ncbi:membrane protein [Nonomuraea ferruginea]
MELGAAHWIYLAGMAVIIGVMVARKNIVIPAVAATFLTAWAYTGDLVSGFRSVFGASLTAAAELFNIFLIIALVTALLGALKSLGADRRMVEPFRVVMRNGHTAFWVMAAVTYVISLFFWPTPAVPLIGAILLPAAIRAGLPPLQSALAMAIAGQGMALSSDYVMQVAPGLSATAAGVEASVVADRAMVLSLITGGVALVLVYVMNRRHILRPSMTHLQAWEALSTSAAETVQETGAQSLPAGSSVPVAHTAAGPVEMTAAGATVAVAPAPQDGGPGHGGPPGEGAGAGRSRAFAVIVPVVLLAVVGYMLLGKFTGLVPETVGSDAAALVGGVVALLLLAASITKDARGSLEACAEHVVDGLVFSMKAMGIVLPIAGFFFIGNGDFAGRILGLEEGAEAPSFLFELVNAAQGAIPSNAFFMAFALLVIGMITGLDGSGFSGLPLTGSLSGALGPAAGVDPATLAAVGQMGAIWAGGGVLIAWSSLIAVAGFARVSVLDLARKAFLPVMLGLLASTLVAVLIF